MSLEFGKKIAALRKMQGVTQVQLADYLMVQPQTVSRWESEGGTPDIMLLPKIATFFSISMDELFGMTDMEQIDHLVYKYPFCGMKSPLKRLWDGLSLHWLRWKTENVRKNGNSCLHGRYIFIFKSPERLRKRRKKFWMN